MNAVTNAIETLIGKDVKIKKVNDTYNTYQCELSFGQLAALRNALANSHDDPVADEAYAEIGWYLDNIPGPGESEDDLKKEEEAAASGMGSPDAEGQPLSPQADDLLPAPPEGEGEGGELGGDAGAGPEEPGGEGEELPGKFMAGGGPGAEGEEPEGEPEPAGVGAETDRRLPRPPEE